jgi:hypothetical protein
VSHHFLRRYGDPTTVHFILIDFGSTDVEPAIDGGVVASGAMPPLFETGDVKVIRVARDGTFLGTGAVSNLPTNAGHGLYTLSLTATEMSAAQIVVRIRDQGEIIRNPSTGAAVLDGSGNPYRTGRKQWEDEQIVIETYGAPEATFGFDLGSMWNART